MYRYCLGATALLFFTDFCEGSLENLTAWVARTEKCNSRGITSASFLGGKPAGEHPGNR
jgi:hypothetical protein